MAKVTESLTTIAIHAAAKSMGYAELHVHQESAVKSFVAGNNVFVAIPMGGGKSLCYSLSVPAVFDKIRGHTSPKCLAIVVAWPYCQQMLVSRFA